MPRGVKGSAPKKEAPKRTYNRKPATDPAKEQAWKLYRDMELLKLETKLKQQFEDWWNG